jgi:hypothetical protein
MPVLRRSLKKGYFYDDSIKNVSKQMELSIINNFKKKDEGMINQDKFVASGIKKHMLSFDKKIKQKIKDNI